MKRLLIIFIVLFMLVSIFYGCTKKREEKEITLGAKAFTEGYILGNLASLLLQENGFNVKENFGMQTFVIREALLNKQIDGYFEYTGTAWSAFFKKDYLIRDSKELFNEVKKEDEKNGIVWINRIDFNDTYALAIRDEDKIKFGTTLSSLAEYINKNQGKVKFAIDHEFYERPDGFDAMAKFYGMKYSKNDIITMDIGLTYPAIVDKTKGIDVAMVFSTDGQLKKYNLFVLEDDKNFFPIYNPAFCIRKEVFEKYPEIEKILEPLTKVLTTEDIINLNYQVDVLGKDEKEVARDYLKSKGLIK
ncbi:MAG: glycine/betaine ABC transporter substrate-binding protein [Caldisericia bacterium]|nr:glycine/betaine ABC transporter substrate-binding protein [Caldisericia bacterium]